MQADPDTDVNKKKNQKDVYRQCEDTTGPIYIFVLSKIYMHGKICLPCMHIYFVRQVNKKFNVCASWNFVYLCMRRWVPPLALTIMFML